MQTLEQTRFLTQNYSNLQGLRAIPSGLCLLLISLWANTLNDQTRDLSLPLLEAAGCLVLYFATNYYYNRVFGKIKRPYTHAEILWSGVSGLLALAAFFVDSDFGLKLPFSTLGLVFAFVILGTSLLYWYQAKVLLISNLCLGGLVTILSLLPLFGLPDWWQALGIKHFLLAMTILFGIYLIIGGIIGHLYFIRALPSISEQKHG